MALAPMALLVACLKGTAPTGLGRNDVRLALVAQVSGGTALHVTVAYLDQPNTPVQLVDQTLNVTAGTSSVPLTIDLTRCLADPQHVSSTGATCELVASVVLMQNGTAVDSVTVGPVVVTPGQVVHATTSVTAVGKVVVFPDSATLTVGAITILRDSVYAASGAYLPNSAVTWSSADTTIATVNDSGAVTGRRIGTTFVRANSGALRDSAVITVIGSGTGGGLVASIPAVEFSAPAGGTVPTNAVLSITSSDSTIVSSLNATITYGSSTTGWLLANVSDSAAPARVTSRLSARRLRAAQYAVESVTTPALLDIVPSTTSLPAGQYTATVTVAGSGGRSTSVSVTYTISSNPAVITITPSTGVTDTAVAGGTGITKPVVITNGGAGTLNGLSESITYHGGATGWLSVNQHATTAPDTLSVTANPGSLSAGTYTASVTVSSTVTGVNTNGFTVTLIVNAGGAVLTFPVDTVTFLEYNYGTTPAPSRQFNVINSGTGALGIITHTGTNWAASPDTGYVSIGITSSTITLTPNTTKLNFIGNQTAVFSFSAAGASNNPQTIIVYMQSSVTYEKVAAGAQFGCGLTTEGSVYCWGDNTYGQWGNNSTTSPDGGYGPARVLLPITATDTVVDIAAGARHACALMSTNHVYCWGDNSQGQLGQGTVSATPVRTPVLVTGGRTYSAISAGSYHTCAIEGTGGANLLDCWGSNSNGQLGINLPSPVTSPTSIGQSFATVSAGANNTCALTALTTGSIYCWGDNTVGQVGVGTTGGNDTLPQAVSINEGTVTPVMVSAGNSVACAIDTNNNAWCWGDNTYGELGTNGGPSVPSPILVSSGQFTTISAGDQFVCGIATTLITAYCWGLNGNGQLGIGTTTNASAPTAISLPFGGAVSALVASPQAPTMCLFESSSAFCAGDNSVGQLGALVTILPVNSTLLGLIDQPASLGTASRVVPRPRVTRRAHK